MVLSSFQLFFLPPVKCTTSKRLILEQIRLKLQLVDGEVKKIKGSINHETLRSLNFRSNQQISKQKHIPQSYQNDQFSTSYPPKLLFLLYLRPHLLFLLSLFGGPTPRFRIIHYEPRCSLNLSVTLRFGKRLLLI